MRSEISDVIADKNRGDGSVMMRGDRSAATKQWHASDSASRRSGAAAELLKLCNWNIIEAARVLKDEAAAAVDRTM